METVIGNVRLRGRPDSYKIIDDKLVIVERKSSRKPKQGAWISDLMQATAYSIILLNRNKERVRDIELEMHYRGGIHKYRVDTDSIHMLLKILDDIIEVKKHGILPVALRSERKCNKCPFREVCYMIDSSNPVNTEELYETGFWLVNEKRVVEK